MILRIGLSGVLWKYIECLATVFSRAAGTEVIYQRALAVELELNKIVFARGFEMPVFFKKVLVGTRRVDFLVEGCLSVELKAVSALDNANLAQGKNYLEAYNLPTGLLINFGAHSLEFKRLFNNKYRPDSH